MAPPVLVGMNFIKLQETTFPRAKEFSFSVDKYLSFPFVRKGHFRIFMKMHRNFYLVRILKKDMLLPFPQFSVSTGIPILYSPCDPLPRLTSRFYSFRLFLSPLRSLLLFPSLSKKPQKSPGLPGLFLLLSYSILRFLPPAFPLTSAHNPLSVSA